MWQEVGVHHQHKPDIAVGHVHIKVNSEVGRVMIVCPLGFSVQQSFCFHPQMIWVPFSSAKEEMKEERKWGEYRGGVSPVATVQKPFPSGTGTVAQPQCLSGNRACIPWRAPRTPIYCADQSSCRLHTFSLSTSPKLYFWRITHSSLSTYKIIVGDGSRISRITSCSISGAGQSWAQQFAKARAHLQERYPLA